MYQKYLPSQIFTALFFNCVFFKFSSKKICWLRNICYCLCNWNFTRWKGESSSFDTTLMRKLLLVCFQLETFSKQKFSMANKRFYSFTFFMHIASFGKPTFMIILNRMIDILWQTAAAVANGTTRRAWTSFLRWKVSHAMERLCLQKINYLRRTYVEIQHFQKLSCGNIFLAQSQKFVSVKLQLFPHFWVYKIFQFYSLSTSVPYLFKRTT